MHVPHRRDLPPQETSAQFMRIFTNGSANDEGHVGVCPSVLEDRVRGWNCPRPAWPSRRPGQRPCARRTRPETKGPLKLTAGPFRKASSERLSGPRCQVFHARILPAHKLAGQTRGSPQRQFGQDLPGLLRRQQLTVFEKSDEAREGLGQHGPLAA